ncbi:unnamed protein product, partial [Symbiodinium pilosum]
MAVIPMYLIVSAFVSSAWVTAMDVDDPDMVLTKAAEAGYEDASLKRALHKSFRAECHFKAWGGEIDGVQGRVGAPKAVRQQVWYLISIVVEKGAPVRLDRSLEADRFEAPRETSQFASACAESLPWAVASSYAFRETSHINLQEARALRREIRRLASCFDNAGRIQVCLNDSMVCVFAFSKGRSSSLKLNNILRGLLPYLVMGDVAPALLWIETAANFADHPSRFRPLPPPCVPLGWLQDFGIFGWASYATFSGCSSMFLFLTTAVFAAIMWICALTAEFAVILADACFAWASGVDEWLEQLVEWSYRNGEKLYWVTLGVLSLQRLAKVVVLEFRLGAHFLQLSRRKWGKDALESLQLGSEAVDEGGRNASQALEDPEGEGGPAAAPGLAPVRPRPLRTGASQPDGATQRVDAPWWSWRPSRWKWSIFFILGIAVLFPRIVALLIALVIRLIDRAVMGLTLQVLKELWAQALLAAAAVEDNFAAWLNVQLGIVMEPPPLLTHGPAVAPQAPATMLQPHPTRPIDVLIILLLGYNIRLGWGGQ